MTAVSIRTHSPTVGIVILNWNSLDVTRRCIASLQLVSDPPLVIYLVDNGSTDNSWYLLTREYGGKRFVLIQNGANLGFAAGCNPGIRRALDDGCDYVLLLNNDTIAADGDFLRQMVDLAESDSTCGVVGGRLLLWPDTSVVWGTGGIISWAGERYLGAGETDVGQYSEIAERQFVSGALMLIRRAVLEELGLLPEAYFFGHEDWEYSWRVRRHGWRLLYQPRAVVYHEAGHSRDAVDPVWIYNSALSKTIFKKRTLSPPSWFLWRLSYALYLELVFPLRARLQPQRLVGQLNASLLRAALRDGLRDGARVSRVTHAHLVDYRTRLMSRSSGTSTP